MMLSKCILLVFISYVVECSHFRGSYITYKVNQTDPSHYPTNIYSQTVKLHFQYGTAWRRSDGSSYCTSTSINTCQYFNHGSWAVYYGNSEVSQPYYYTSFTAGFYCERYSIPGDFTVGSNSITVLAPRAHTIKVVTSSCCWVGNLAAYSSSSWNVQLLISLKSRPYPLSGLNSPPQISHIPVIQHLTYQYYNYYYYQRNRQTHYRLPVSDPDNDLVKCRWAANFTEGGGVWNSRIGTLHENCTLTLLGYYGAYSTGWRALAIMVEDYAYSYYSGYTRMSSVPLQFTVFIYRYARLAVVGNDTTQCGNNTSRVLNMVSLTAKSSVVPYASAHPVPMSSAVVTASAVATTPASQGLDGCKIYQVLSNGDRSSNYSDWSNYRCDSELYGWYRFMGQAGNRMLDSCPYAHGVYSYKCGSYYQGWIVSGSMPSVYQGVVSRYVCFSPYYSCSCSYQKSILIKNCGTFHVYWLGGVPSCNLRYCGKKDNTSVVSCSRDYMRIDIDRKYYDASLYSSITLKNPSCSATFSSSSITLGAVPGDCGATRKDTTNHIVYENQVILTAKPTARVITRELDQTIIFTCSYGRNGSISSPVFKPSTSINVTERGFGNFAFYFMMYTDRTFRVAHTQYPVAVKLRDTMHFEIHANVRDTNVVVLVDQCYSTPTMDRNHYLKYVFINNRCAQDNTVSFHSGPNNKQRFSVQAFRFLNSNTAVYFHCLVFLCHKSSSDSRCSYGCQGNNIHRGKREISNLNEPSKYYMLEYKVSLKSEDKNNQNSGGKSAANSSIVTISAAVGFCVLAIVIVGLAVKVNKMHRVARVSPSAGQASSKYANEETPVDANKVSPPEYEEKQMSMKELTGIGVINESMQAEMFTH